MFYSYPIVAPSSYMTQNKGAGLQKLRRISDRQVELGDARARKLTGRGQAAMWLRAARRLVSWRGRLRI